MFNEINGSLELNEDLLEGQERFTVFVGELVANIALVDSDHKRNDGPYEKSYLHDFNVLFGASFKY